MQENEYYKKAAAAFEQYKELNAREDWTLVKEGDGAVLTSLPLEGEPINCFRFPPVFFFIIIIITD
jgi:hypothetical protein